LKHESEKILIPDGSSSLSDLSAMNVHILTYGCTFNAGDSRKLEAVLLSQGCRIVDSSDEAEVIMVNTCTVIGRTERKMIKILEKFCDKRLYVTGCMPLVQAEEILSVCKPSFIHPEEISRAYRSCHRFPSHDVGIVQIGRGCLGSCTYCITRMARGPLVSYSEQEIINEVKMSVRSGAAEIRLTGQDCSAWGRDRGDNLARLIDSIGTIRGDFRIRVGMMNPDTILPIVDRLIDAFGHQNIFRFIHIPVQSGSEKVIRDMGRRYTAYDVLEIVGEFRKKFPDISIATDVISGYPGETDDDFEETLSLVHAMQPVKVNHTRFSARPGTLAEKEKDLPDSVKKTRSRRMQRSAEEICQTLNRSLIGTVMKVRVTEKIKAGSVLARTDNYTGVLLCEELPIGTELLARITGDRIYYVIGKRVT
jgi:threonylcarbamoyladenosine tRNA methylthiotransferase CDKAL1